MKLQIKKLSDSAVLPHYEHPGDAGLDCYADSSYVIEPGERTLVSTGIAMAIPDGYVGLIWDKSGLATNVGLTTLAGVIDSSYRGEIHILLHNTGDKAYHIEAGKKIAQLLVQPVVQPELIQVTELDATSRGGNGFGSTGI